MTLSRKVSTQEDLEDADISDAVRSFIALEARKWQRDQRNRVLPAVFRQVDAAREDNRDPDVPAIIKMVWLERSLPLLVSEE